MNDELHELIPVIQQWAGSQSYIKRVWVFGSRLKGTHKPDSDLDIAVEVQWVDGIGERGNDFSVWFAAKELIGDSLHALVPMDVDLQWYGGRTATDKMHKYLNESSMVIYPCESPKV